MEEIKITRAATLKEKPDSSTLVFGQSMTDHMFLVDYDAGRRSIRRPKCCTMPRRFSRG